MATLTPEQKVAVLQRFVDAFPTDLLAVRAALGDKTPEAAQRFLIGGLNYALDMLDIFPDHYKGLGVADDAIVLRLASKLALAAGATDDHVVKLAAEVSDVASVFDYDLAGPLEQLVAQMPDREVRGRTASKILSHKDTKIMFDADIGREAKRYAPQTIDTTVQGPERAIIELRKMIEAALKKAGIAK
jgi:uncharacterized membrane protein YkvA (DUF1232 family)